MNDHPLKEKEGGSTRTAESELPTGHSKQTCRIFLRIKNIQCSTFRTPLTQSMVCSDRKGGGSTRTAKSELPTGHTKQPCRIFLRIKNIQCSTFRTPLTQSMVCSHNSKTKSPCIED